LIALCDEIMNFGMTYKSNEVKFDRANMLYKYKHFFFGLISGRGGGEGAIKPPISNPSHDYEQ
jgi:hypothetical protein